MLNNWTGMGRLVKDPEYRTTQSGVPVVNFTIACDTDFGEKHTDFISIVAWRQTAEFVSRYFKKGSMAIITGRLQSRKWEDRDGNKRTDWDIIADRIYFGEKRQESTAAPNVQYEEIQEDDGELPF